MWNIFAGVGAATYCRAIEISVAKSVQPLCTQRMHENAVFFLGKVHSSSDLHRGRLWHIFWHSI